MQYAEQPVSDPILNSSKTNVYINTFWSILKSSSTFANNRKGSKSVEYICWRYIYQDINLTNCKTLQMMRKMQKWQIREIVQSSISQKQELARLHIWAWYVYCISKQIWWRHQMETFSALLALCAGNSPVTGEFPSKRPVTQSFDIFFDLRLNKRLCKQSWGWWFETQSRSLWRHCNFYL